jgi:hypothetical protein
MLLLWLSMLLWLLLFLLRLFFLLLRGRRDKSSKSRK